MGQYYFIVVRVASIIALASSAHSLPHPADETRSGRVFPILNVVQFSNAPCTSASAIVGASSGTSFRNGTCFTQNECQNKGGSVSGSCALGFGICCLFLVDSGDVMENGTYIRSANFPAPFIGDGVHYQVYKSSPNICHLRLDFETFNLAGPALSGEEFGGMCTDSVDILTSTGVTYPTICGVNTGQHIFVELDAEPPNIVAARVGFIIDLTAVAAFNRQWEIKVTQFECSHYAAPPKGCFQYMTDMTGTIKTFNFDGTNGHLKNQDYSVCIRQEPGFCCVRYMPCPGEPMAFTLDINANAVLGMGFVDNLCTRDYVGIEASSAQCGGGVAPVNSKYCGTFLASTSNPLTGSTQNVPICDCTPPFLVSIFTDIHDDSFDGTAVYPGLPNIILSKGICLTYMQVSCK